MFLALFEVAAVSAKETLHVNHDSVVPLMDVIYFVMSHVTCV